MALPVAAAAIVPDGSVRGLLCLAAAYDASNESYHYRAEARAGAEKLNDVHSAVELVVRALHDPAESGERNHQWNYQNHNRRAFAINHALIVSLLQLPYCAGCVSLSPGTGGMLPSEECAHYPRAKIHR